MKIKIFFLFLIFYFFTIGLPLANAKGLVPCGPGEPPQAEDIKLGLDYHSCTFCDFGKLITKVINFAIYGIALPLAVIFIVWGGFLIMTGGGNPEQLKRGRKTIWAAIIGAAIVLGAWLIVDTIIKLIASPAAKLGTWNIIKC